MTELTDQLALERRRSVRLRRSSLLKVKLEDIDRPNIKIAETYDELSQSFSMVYTEYRSCGYIRKEHPSELHFSLYNLLPETCVFIFRSYTTVISSLTQIFDSPEFGLPMDALYKGQLDDLRKKGRKITELSALVSPKEVRWCNLMIYLSRIMFEYSMTAHVDDICIMVNPKHVKFYKTMFLFEDFGEEYFYEPVGAPAVALRINMDNILEKIEENYKNFDLDINLYNFFCKVNTPQDELNHGHTFPIRKIPLDDLTLQMLLERRYDILFNITSLQRKALQMIYPNRIDQYYDLPQEEPT